MNSLISINSKFMILNPKELIELILDSKYTKGVEIFINFENEFQRKYLDDLVFELGKNNLILQIHGDVELDYNTQIEYMKQLEKYSDYLGYPIVVTLHTIYDDDKEESLEKSMIYLSDIIDNIDNNKIIICLENLNDAIGTFRLGKEDITKSILNNDRLYFTYDIGHEIADFGDLINLNSYLIEEIRNIHIHSNDDKGNDHCPIYKNDAHWNDIIKGLIFLINNKYQYNIVYEYGLEYCHGETTKEKIVDYLNSIDFVSQKYGSE